MRRSRVKVPSTTVTVKGWSGCARSISQWPADRCGGLLLPTQSRRAREYQMLRGVGLFDDQSYLARYADVAAEQMDPLDHYVAHGMCEGRERA